MARQAPVMKDFDGEERTETDSPSGAAPPQARPHGSRSARFRFQFQSRTLSREGKACLLPRRRRNPLQDARVGREAEVGPRRRSRSETACEDWLELDWRRERCPLATGTKLRGRTPNLVQLGKASIQATSAPFPRSAAQPTDHDDPSRSRLTTAILHESFDGRPPSTRNRSTKARPQRRKKPSPPGSPLSTIPPTLFLFETGGPALPGSGELLVSAILTPAGWRPKASWQV